MTVRFPLHSAKRPDTLRFNEELMKILFIGGTRFVGLAMAREALQRGHQVDLFHRGTTQTAYLGGARELRGDRNSDLGALAAGQWDAVVDACAYRPHEIGSMSAALGGRIGCYVFVSSVSVYADDIARGSDESARRCDTGILAADTLERVAIDARSYGPLKVLCEDEVRRQNARSLLIRPTYVIGPHDYTQRFPEWVRRIAAGGEIAAPGPRDEPAQCIDARDLAGFTISALESGLQGIFNAVGPADPMTFEDLLETIVAAVGPAGTRLHWLSVDEAKSSGQSYPLWGEGRYSGRSAVSARAAYTRGLHCRPLAESTRDVLDWIRVGGK
jgi:2'-hydroxyisoflavone reductase